MAKKVDPAMLESLYSRMTLDQLQELRATLVVQLAAIDKQIQDKSPEVSGNE